MAEVFENPILLINFTSQRFETYSFEKKPAKENINL